MTDIVERKTWATEDIALIKDQVDTITALRAEIAAKDKSIHELEEMVSATEEERNDILCAKDKEIARLREALAVGRDLVGPWLSGALDDPETCEAMKGDISAFFEAIERCASASEDEMKERLGAIDPPENPAAGARPGAGDIPEAAPEKF